MQEERDILMRCADGGYCNNDRNILLPSAFLRPSYPQYIQPQFSCSSKMFLSEHCRKACAGVTCCVLFLPFPSCHGKLWIETVCPCPYVLYQAFHTSLSRALSSLQQTCRCSVCLSLIPQVCASRYILFRNSISYRLPF